VCEFVCRSRGKLRSRWQSGYPRAQHANSFDAAWQMRVPFFDHILRRYVAFWDASFQANGDPDLKLIIYSPAS
jgi:hypothetical protein